jgi:hypothetical protein
VIRWRCDKCPECIATVSDGWWRPTTVDPLGGSRRADKRKALRLGHYEDTTKFDSEDEVPWSDVVAPKELAASKLAGLPRDAVLYGLCPRDGIRKVRLADVRHKLAR